MNNINNNINIMNHLPFPPLCDLTTYCFYPPKGFLAFFYLGFYDFFTYDLPPEC